MNLLHILLGVLDLLLLKWEFLPLSSFKSSDHYYMEITTFANYFTEKKNYRENQDEWGTVLCTNQTDKLSALPNPSLEQFPFPKEVVRKMEVLVISPLAIWDFPFTPSLFLESFDTILAIKWQNNFFSLISSLSWHIYLSSAIHTG